MPEQIVSFMKYDIPVSSLVYITQVDYKYRICTHDILKHRSKYIKIDCDDGNIINDVIAVCDNLPSSFIKIADTIINISYIKYYKTSTLLLTNTYAYDVIDIVMKNNKLFRYNYHRTHLYTYNFIYSYCIIEYNITQYDFDKAMLSIVKNKWTNPGHFMWLTSTNKSYLMCLVNYNCISSIKLSIDTMSKLFYSDTQTIHRAKILFKHNDYLEFTTNDIYRQIELDQITRQQSCVDNC